MQKELNYYATQRTQPSFYWTQAKNEAFLLGKIYDSTSDITYQCYKYQFATAKVSETKSTFEKFTQIIIRFLFHLILYHFCVVVAPAISKHYTTPSNTHGMHAPLPTPNYPIIWPYAQKGILRHRHSADSETDTQISLVIPFSNHTLFQPFLLVLFIQTLPILNYYGALTQSFLAFIRLFVRIHTLHEPHHPVMITFAASSCSATLKPLPPKHQIAGRFRRNCNHTDNN